MDIDDAGDAFAYDVGATDDMALDAGANGASGVGAAATGGVGGGGGGGGRRGDSARAWWGGEAGVLAANRADLRSLFVGCLSVGAWVLWVYCQCWPKV